MTFPFLSWSAWTLKITFVCAPYIPLSNPHFYYRHSVWNSCQDLKEDITCKVHKESLLTICSATNIQLLSASPQCTQYTITCLNTHSHTLKDTLSHTHTHTHAPMALKDTESEFNQQVFWVFFSFFVLFLFNFWLFLLSLNQLEKNAKKKNTNKITIKHLIFSSFALRSIWAARNKILDTHAQTCTHCDMCTHTHTLKKRFEIT